MAQKYFPVRSCVVLLGIICTITITEGVTQVDRSQIRNIQSRKLFSSPDVDRSLSDEEWQKILAMVGGGPNTGKGVDSADEYSALENAASLLMPELKRIQTETTSSVPVATATSTTETPQRFTTRRFYRRLRRKPTASTTTEVPVTTTLAPSTVTVKDEVAKSTILPVVVPSSAESPRLLQTGMGPSPTDLINQLSLINGILGALNSSSQSTSTISATPNSNAIKNATPIPDIIAFLTGAKNMADASSKSEVIVPPPSTPSPVPVQLDTLELLNLLSNANNQIRETTTTGNRGATTNSATNLLNLMAQSQSANQQPVRDTDTTAALTKLLMQSAVPAVQGNSIVPSQNIQPNVDQANQLNTLINLLGVLGSPGAPQQPQSSQVGSINNLFSMGGDQSAQAQNSLATLFGSQNQQSSNLLGLLGGNQGNQGFNLASLLTPQAGSSIPGLGLLSTVSGLGSSIFSTVANIFGASPDGKPRVRGKGVDTRLGLGYRLGNIGDAQVVWEIGPQLFTEPLRNEMRPYTQKRESGLPAETSNYYEPSLATAAEKTMQENEAKRRMVQAALQEHIRGNQFASVYPQPSQRRSSPYGTNKKSSPSTSSTSSSSFFSSIPFADHLRGFWSGLTSGITNNNDSADDSSSSSAASEYNFDDVRTDFSNNLMKRSSPDYTEYESRAYHPRRKEDDRTDPSHSTLTDYERLLLQHGKDVGVANTKHGVVEEPQPSESSFFSRWFKSSPSSPASNTEVDSRVSQSSQRSQWNSRNNGFSTRNPTAGSNTLPAKPYRQSYQSSAKKSYSTDPSFNGRNDVQGRSSSHPRRNSNQRPPKRRSHNPFRNWLSSFKSAPTPPKSRTHQTVGFGRRQFTRPSVSGNPKLQHFKNMNKDLLMADANDDFVESAGVESYVPRFQQPLSYHHDKEFPDVPQSSRRYKPSSFASLTHAEHIVEPALLYDHLEVSEEISNPEADESFDNRNKVGVNPTLREMEKKKVLGTTAAKHQQAITKIQRLRVSNKNRSTTAGKQQIIVKSKGTSPRNKPISAGIKTHGTSESSTAFPSVFSTIGTILSGTTKPKLKTLLENAPSFLPSIRILPRKKNNEDSKARTKLTIQNGKPAIIVPMSDDDDDQETAADEVEPFVQVGHDMSFDDFQSLIGSSIKNNTKKRRFRIRVKESVLNGDNVEQSRKDGEGEDEDNDDAKDIFVDIESGEVSVLKPVASLISFAPKKEESSDEEDVDYYEDEDGDGVADVDMNRKEHIFDAIQTQLVSSFEKMKKRAQKAEAKKRRKQELAEKGMDESMDVVTKYFDLLQNTSEQEKTKKPKPVGGLSL